MAKSLATLRRNRTIHSNRVHRRIERLLTQEAKWHDGPNGLPSWWVLWSDDLKHTVREAVHAALALERAESAHQ